MNNDNYLDRLTIAANQKIKERNYWLEKLSGELHRSNLPYDSTEKKSDFNKNNHVNTLYRGELYHALMKLSKGADNRLHIILTAATLVILNRYTDNNDLLIGVPIYKQEIEGEFINTVLTLRISLQEKMTFKELLLEIVREITESSKHENYPVELLPHQLKLDQSYWENGFPLFDVVVMLNNIHEREYIAHIQVNTLFTFSRSQDSIQAILEYNPERFEEVSMHRISAQLEFFLQTVLTDLDSPIANLDIHGEREKKRLLYGLNNTSAQYPTQKTIDRIFKEQVHLHPDDIALIEDSTGSTLSYDGLNQKANQLACHLRGKGVGPDSIVGFLISRKIEMIIGIYGVIIAGGAYLPIDPDYPSERIEFMLADSNVDILLTDNQLSRNVEFDGTIIDLEDQSVYNSNSSNSHHIATSENLVYVIYTSGSTGKPKGVTIEHRPLINRLNWMQKHFTLDNTDTILQKTPFTFDVSVWELIWWSLVGAKLCLLVPGGEKDPQVIAETIERNQVTIMHFVPSMLNAFLEYIEDSPVIEKITGLKQVIASGEALTVSQVNKFNRLLNVTNGTRLTNLYGPTEATIDVSYFDCSKEDFLSRIPIGKPIDNIQLFVLGKGYRLQPIGVPGELCIAGDGLARGYLNRPQLTASKFITTSISHLPSLVIYKTGDLVRWMDDGNLEFIGRIDFQVKIRGFRIELGEIENRLSEIDIIKEAIVVVLKDGNGNDYLCAYVVPRQELSRSRLRDYLRSSLSRVLPEHMLPLYFEPLKKIPLTSNGKADRKALPEPELGSGEEYVPPSTKSEHILVEIWTSVLALDKIGINDNFFNIGGDSIKAIKLVSTINTRFNKGLIILDLYNHPTIEKLALKVEQTPDKDVEKERLKLEASAIEIEELKNRIMTEYKLEGDIEDIYPMSDIEKGMVFYRLRYPDEAVYHDQFNYTMKIYNFDPMRFKKAFILMMEKHPILRTAFNVESFGEPVQIVYRNIEPDIIHEDISQMTKQEKEAYLIKVLEKDRQNLFDVHTPPLCRMKTFDIGNNDIFVVWIFFHAILDGWGNAVLMTELNNTYVRLKANSNYVPEPLKSTYKDFIIHEVTRKKNQEDVEYWRKELDQYKRIDFSGFKNKHSQSNQMRTDWYRMEPSFLRRIENAAKKYGSNVKNICFGAYIFMLNMISAENDVVVGLVSNSRPVTEESDKVVGCFLNTVPFRVKIPAGITWAQYISLIDKKMLEVKKYDYNSLIEILRFIDEKPQNENPIFDTIFNLVDFHIYTKMESETVAEEDKKKEANFQENPTDDIYVERYENSNTFFDFAITTTTGFFIPSLSFVDHMFSEESGRNFYHYFINALEQIMTAPDAIASKDKLLPPELKRSLLIEFNSAKNHTEADKLIPHKRSIYHLVEKYALETPERIALKHNGDTVTYEELNRNANRIASQLRETGIGKDKTIGILMHRSVGMVESILATWKAGAAYIPLDTQYPPERISDVLKDSISLVLLTQTEHYPHQLDSIYDGRIFYIDQPVQMTSISFENHNLSLDIDTLSYVIYTSGSTGKPKGAMVEHKGMMNHIRAKIDDLQLTAQSIVAQNSSHTFDISVWQFFASLSVGGQTVIYSNEMVMEPGTFISEVISDHITILEVVPSYLSLLLETIRTMESLPILPLKWLLVTGEEVKPNLVNRWFDIYPQIKIVNAYGPTEASDDITHHIMDKGGEVERIPIGKPLRNLNIYIVDNNMELCPIGVKGEICVSGIGVGRGYLNDEEKTRAVFLEDPFIEEKGVRLYKTGDLGRWIPEGTIEFFGRKDFQVKVRGFRIELGEIESKLTSHPMIKDAVVVILETHHDKYLCAYIVGDENLDFSQVREFLMEYLPAYMVPAHFIKMEKIPLTPNGKVDRKKLPEPDAELDLGADFVKPRNDTEEKLAILWSEVLKINVETISIDNDFFESGGHSIAAIGLAAKIHQEFDVKIPVAELFKRANIKSLAEYIGHAGREDFIPIEKAEIREFYPLSSVQESIYLAQQLTLDSTAFSLPTVLSMEGIPDIAKLEHSFKQLIQRHESLRTSFQLIHAKVIQKIHMEIDFEIERFLGCESEKNEIFNSFIRPFDLSQAPLIRVGVMEITDSDTSHYMLMIDIHHIICDGISHEILTRDFIAIDRGEELPPLKLQYKDYTQWEHSEKQQAVIAKQQQYWINQFKDNLPIIDLPLDFKRPEIQSFEGETLDFSLKRENVAALRTIALEQDVTMFMLTLAIQNVLLSKLSGSEDIVVGSSLAGRRHVELQEVIGMFVNLLPLRNFPVQEKLFSHFLQDVKTRTLEAYENQEYQFERLVDEVVKQRDKSRHPIFDTAFGLRNIEAEVEGMSDEEVKKWGQGQTQFKRDSAKFDLTVHINETAKDLFITMEYCTKIFKKETIQRFIEYFKDITATIIENPHIKIKDISLDYELSDAGDDVEFGDFGF